jgi:hypothetical protein
MKLLKKTFHWLAFITIAPNLTWLIMAISLYIPIYAFQKMIDLGTFMFILAMSLVTAAYYGIYTFLAGLSFMAINKMKPDYWVSNIILSIIAIFFFYYWYLTFGKLLFVDFDILSSSKGIMLIVSYTPGFLRLIYQSLILPFVHDDEEKWLYLLS